ncbi:MAG: hypothetical protein OQL27_13245 [Sedimenticola sp.]|nr:hypothetical protein [Sedimenticola sp.]
MESTDDFWGFLDRMPVLLQQYSTHSYVLLTLLGAAGAILLGWHIFKKKSSGEGLSTLMFAAGGMLLFLSISGAILKFSVEVGEQRQGAAAIARFLEDHRVNDDEHWVIVVDFTGSIANTGDEAHTINQDKMKLFVAGIKEVLLDDIPEAFSQPRVKLIPTQDSPWNKGVDDNNFDEVIDQLNGDELMWGIVQKESMSGKAFLALSAQLGNTAGQDLGRQAPLHDLDFNSDLRRDFQFNRGGYSRLIGMVMLGMSLETVQRAQQAQGEDRRKEFLKASKQLTAMRKKVSGSRDDPILKRTVFGSQVDDLITLSEQEAEGRL